MNQSLQIYLRPFWALLDNDTCTTSWLNARERKSRATSQNLSNAESLLFSPKSSFLKDKILGQIKSCAYCTDLLGLLKWSYGLNKDCCWNATIPNVREKFQKKKEKIVVLYVCNCVLIFKNYHFHRKLNCQETLVLANKLIRPHWSSEYSLIHVSWI